MKYFECTVTYEKPDDTGKISKCSDVYLTTAEIFGEAENTVLTRVSSELAVVPEVTGIRVVKYSSVLEKENTVGPWYKVKIKWEDVSEKGKLVTYKEDHLVPASTPTEALSKITKAIDEVLVDYEILSVGKSKICGIYLTD